MPRRLSAAEIAHALGGRRSGNAYLARCPAHDDRSPSLSIADSADGADGRVLVFCHAGCSQQAVIAALTVRGLWRRPSLVSRPQSKRSRQEIGALSVDGSAKRERALEIWSEARPSEGTLVESYLRNRGITLSVSPAIRFHERLWHTPSARAWPAMVALIRDGLSGDPLAVHRTYLAPSGLSKAPIESAKMMLGSTRGGGVHLADATDSLMIGEGIETCLSVLQATGVSTWAALSANGLKVLNLPPGIATVTIVADGDPAGEAAAQAAARRLRLSVRTVRIARAPHGQDFNDLLNRVKGS